MTFALSGVIAIGIRAGNSEAIKKLSNFSIGRNATVNSGMFIFATYNTFFKATQPAFFKANSNKQINIKEYNIINTIVTGQRY